jgi:DNA-binding LytR/AlgR family response regulator
VINAIAIDDEKSALNALSIITNSFSSQISLLACFTNTKAAYDFLNTHIVDVIFLDINLFSINGMDWYMDLQRKIPVVFCTAYDKYAVKAFEIHALDYLTKPISIPRFANTLERIVQKLNEGAGEQELVIKADLNWHKIKYSDILFIKALDDYIKIFIINTKPLLIKSTLKDMVLKLPVKQFMRVHRSYIVSIRNISSMDTHKLSVFDHKIPISKSYRNDILKMYKSLSVN